MEKITTSLKKDTVTLKKYIREENNFTLQLKEIAVVTSNVESNISKRKVQ